MNINYFNNLVNGLVDCQINNNLDIETKRIFHIENSDDFATILGTIDSPRIEHILQNFSQLFSRIGLDDLNKEYIDKLNKFVVCV